MGWIVPVVTTAAGLIGSALSKDKKADEHVSDSLMSRHQFSRQFLKLMKKIKINGRPHDLRHTFASHLAMAGTPIPVIQEFLGHSAIATTMIYAHMINKGGIGITSPADMD